MRDILISNLIAIDTNVFQHLLNSQNNSDYHISQLLEYLRCLGTSLLVDDKGAIFGEYCRQLVPTIHNADDSREEIYILRYWILNAPRLRVSVTRDQLMIQIRKVIIEFENTDRTFVYVAFKQGTALVTNDRSHIVDGPGSGSTFRRDILRKKTAKLCPQTARIMTSEEAHAAMISS